MAEKLPEKEKVSIDELVLSMVWEREALYNLLEQKGLISKDELLNELKRIKLVNHKKV